MIRRQLASAIAAMSPAPAIVAVRAPPASGKSTLLQQIADLSAAAGRSVTLTVGRSLEDTFSSTAISALIEETRGSYVRSADLIVVDDAEDAPAHILSSLSSAIARLPAGRISLVLGSAQPLKAPLGAFRLQGKVLEYGLRDLALSAAEAREMAGLHIADAMSPAFQTLMTRTEGWVGAWRWICDQIASGQGLRRIAQRLDGSAPHFRSYFEEEAIGPLDDELRAFVTQTGFIWPLEPAMAVHLAGESGGRWLRDALSKCAFLGGEEDTGRTGVHPLFKDFLVDRERQASPERLAATYRAGAAWFKNRSEWPKAAEMLLAAGEDAAAATLLEENADAIFTDVGDAALLFERHDGALLQSPTAQTAVSALIRGAAPIPTEAGRDMDQSNLFGKILSDFGKDESTAVRIAAERWLAEPEGSALHRATIANALAMAHYSDLNVREMQQALERATVEAHRARSTFLQAWCAIGWAFYYVEIGQNASAKEALLGSLESTSLQGRARNTTEAVLAWVELQMGNYDQATLLIGRSLGPSSRHATTQTQVVGWATAAQCVERQAGLDEALAVIKQGRGVVDKRSGERAALLLRIFACQIALRHDPRHRRDGVQQEFEQIQQLASGRNFGRGFEEDLRLLGARLMLESDRLRDAASLVQTIVRRAHSSNRAKRWAEAMVIRIGIAIAEGAHVPATRLFWTCEAGLGRGQSSHQILIAEANLFRPIIQLLIEQANMAGSTDAHRQLIREIAKAVGVTLSSAEVTVPGTSDVIARLTCTETRVVELISMGLTNDEAADRLGVSTATVKWHLRNVYQKMEVRSRTAAIAKMRRLNMLA